MKFPNKIYFMPVLSKLSYLQFIVNNIKINIFLPSIAIETNFNKYKWDLFNIFSVFCRLDTEEIII